MYLNIQDSKANMIIDLLIDKIHNLQNQLDKESESSDESDSDFKTTIKLFTKFLSQQEKSVADDFIQFLKCTNEVGTDFYKTSFHDFLWLIEDYCDTSDVVVKESAVKMHNFQESVNNLRMSIKG